MPNEPKLKLTIVAPHHVQRRRGRFSVANEKFATKIRVMFNDFDKEVVEKAAAIYGVSVSEWLRWCSVQCAADAIEHVEGRRPPVDP